ncbi:DUF7344 domain-containing protein [Natrononativus amylolyticus]|uniref:DUF7344 domain-containing protein n=1 Tax=Natrononativus amylolyticus TaxID=2963434 RepID=UPI0020CEC4E2|nr:transcriptional regulator [Natrononativus amylolyticus]
MDGANWERIFGALASEHRRRLLLSLLERDPQDDRVTSGVGPSAREHHERTRLALAHAHLPALEDAGYVTWHREHGEITAGPNFAEIQPTLETLVETQKSYSD